MGGVFHHLSMVHLWHDMSHSSYSKNSSLWKYFGIYGEWVTGHSMYIWVHRHVFGVKKKLLKKINDSFLASYLDKCSWC